MLEILFSKNNCKYEILNHLYFGPNFVFWRTALGCFSQCFSLMFRCRLTMVTMGPHTHTHTHTHTHHHHHHHKKKLPTALATFVLWSTLNKISKQNKNIEGWLQSNHRDTKLMVSLSRLQYTDLRSHPRSSITHFLPVVAMKRKHFEIQGSRRQQQSYFTNTLCVFKSMLYFDSIDINNQIRYYLTANKKELSGNSVWSWS